MRRIIADLEAAGYLGKRRSGRVNQDRVHQELPLRRFSLQAVEVAALWQALRRSKTP